MPKVEIIETKDGSSSLYLPEMDETYHSTHGALTEALYVFLDKALEAYLSAFPEKKKIRILEIGFGTGLNAWLTAIHVKGKDYQVEYSSLEKFPVSEEVVSKLNYTKDRSEDEKNLFAQVHDVVWNQPVQIHEGFTLEKVEKDVFDFPIKPDQFDVIYFDAFAPSKQPEMWSLEVLQKMYDCLSEGGVFSTYCAQGQFKRDLKSVGFQLESLDGPPGKKEMTRGFKQSL